jgi:VanZ family protein
MAVSSAVRRVFVALAWGLAAFIVFATWGPQATRPHLASAAVERFGAYFVTAMAFVLAYPRRSILIGAAAVAFAVVLALGQFLAPGRDPGVRDVIEKALGGILGAVVTAGVLSLAKAVPRPSPE